MNKRERMLTVLSGKQADRVPASFWHHFGPEQSEGEACVQAHLDYYKSTGIDFIKIMSDGLGYPLDVTINCAADWRKVKPLPKDHPFFTESVKRCKEINRALKDETVTFYNVFSPFNVVRERDVFTEEALQGRSWDATVMAQLRESPEAEEAIRQAMHIIGEDMAYLAKAVIVEGGCLGIYQSVQGAEKGRMSAEMCIRDRTQHDIMVEEIVIAPVQIARQRIADHRDEDRHQHHRYHRYVETVAHVHEVILAGHELLNVVQRKMLGQREEVLRGLIQRLEGVGDHQIHRPEDNDQSKQQNEDFPEAPERIFPMTDDHVKRTVRLLRLAHQPFTPFLEEILVCTADSMAMITNSVTASAHATL